MQVRFTTLLRCTRQYHTTPHPTNPYVKILDSGLWVIDHSPFVADHVAFTRKFGSPDSNAAYFTSIFKDDPTERTDAESKALVAKAVAEGL
jgi:hypothetical protein